jgi:hypothetical protein
VPGNWARATAHFLRYLPPQVDHWLVALQSGAHDRIEQHVLPLLKSATVVDLDALPPAALRDLAQSNRGCAEVGLLDFSVNTGRLWDGERQAAMAEFARWPIGRVRRCFDVWDANFAALFDEDPDAVARRCTALHHAVGSAARIDYHDPTTGEGLTFACGGSTWTAYTGFAEFDYILPSGEVSCLPRSVDGELDVEGWIIGTIPFGLKYGRIGRGDLRLRFAHGEVTTVSGRNTALCRDLETAFERLAGLRSVGELGIGQSVAVTRAADLHEMACQWHERHRGLHVGLGIELAEADHDGRGGTSHHLDVVLAGGRLSADDRPVLAW